MVNVSAEGVRKDVYTSAFGTSSLRSGLCTAAATLKVSEVVVLLIVWVRSEDDKYLSSSRCQ